ncbi:YhcH/YjgK/YiaL family protein [Lentisphaerota bacterium ZTH]|nr:YhcH/YjgK/YiaL family protein [Lentisphaerota bacterium]WET07362.1 YhcH/YjgK/YiaL family protein [Lentisphaerota bacterium ZTH]
MIFDQCVNWKNYVSGGNEAFRKAFEFLSGLDPNCEEGRIDIDGDAIFAVVQSYETKSPAESKIEIHRRYVDIQTLLSGTERIFYSDICTLEEIGDFNEEKDCGFYKYNPDTAVELKISPGTFAVFMAEEGHMPCISPQCGSCTAKKVVIKIDSALLK